MCQVLWSLGYPSLWQPQMLQSLGSPEPWQSLLQGGRGGGLAGTGSAGWSAEM